MAKIYYNSKLAKWLLFPGFHTLMFFGAIITKKSELSQDTITHETIHVWQFWEAWLLGLPVWLLLMALTGAWACIFLCPLTYYIMYGLEVGVSFVYHLARRVCKCVRVALQDEKLPPIGDPVYYNCAFEEEAYQNEDNPDYLKKRPLFAFFKYYGKV